MTHLDSDLLRTFLVVSETGSISGAALRINRSQSATSLQIRQLETAAGQALFVRHGRGVTLSKAGEQLLPVARQVTNTLDAALADLRGERLEGRLRIGVSDNHSRAALVRIIADFTSRHPDVELEVGCALGTHFEAELESGALDLAVFEVREPAVGDDILRENRLAWMCSRNSDFGSRTVLPIAVFDQACWWRDAALSSLEAAARRFRIVFTSESDVGVRAAVRAGIAAGLLDTHENLDGLALLPDMDTKYPSFLVLRRGRGAKGPICDAMCEAVGKAFQGH
ncbi:MAG: LysR family transcriptional regulator [Rhodobiaceae bacterium]|nr:LysR family transcriptional regulator [Rhodobiaceae bacterium]MCC0049640.1 LysR family transcriptional regulator [Rhodobiaceae bacterium]